MTAVLEKSIKKALARTNSKNELDLRKYIPSQADDKSGYLHHFSLNKMKKTNPEQLNKLIEEFILTPPSPKPIAGGKRNQKSRFPRSESSMLIKLINIALKSGDQDAVRYLIEKCSIKEIRHAFIRTLMERKIDEQLWEAYKASVRSSQ